MIYWVVQYTIISLTLIILVHYIYTFLIDTLTVPKLRDFVNKPTDRYNEMLSSASKTEQPVVNNDMQTELRDFLTNIKRDPNNDLQ